MVFLIISGLVCPALIAIALSVWLRPEVGLGKPFWTLTIFFDRAAFLSVCTMADDAK
jgi:hypothetical protein